MKETNDIEKYINDNNIPCRYDKTNNSKDYTRNRIRLNILPLLKLEDENIHNKFISFNEELELSSNYIKEQVNIAIKDNYNNNMRHSAHCLR